MVEQWMVFSYSPHMFKTIQIDSPTQSWTQRRVRRLRTRLLQDPFNPKQRTLDNVNGAKKIGDWDLDAAIRRDRTPLQTIEVILRNHLGLMVAGLGLANLAALLYMISGI